jgi:hypothetical protein
MAAIVVAESDHFVGLDGSDGLRHGVDPFFAVAIEISNALAVHRSPSQSVSCLNELFACAACLEASDDTMH